MHAVVVIASLLASTVVAHAQSTKAPPQPAPGASAQAPAAAGPSAQAAPSTPAAVPAEPRSTSAVFGDWVMACQRIEGSTPPKVCEATHSVQIQGQPGPILQVAIAKGAKPNERRVTIVVPTNISIAAAPRMAAQDKDPQPLQLAWATCVPGGCFANATLADDAVKRMRDASSPGSVTVTDASGRNVVIQVSYRGLAQALDALAKE